MTAATSATAAPPATPLPVRQRPDLVIVATGDDAAPRWTVKDPLSLQYYQLRLHDYFVLQQLDGETSLQEIEERFFRQFSPQRLSQQQILQFIHRLMSQGLVTVDRYGLSPLLLERARVRQRAERRGWLLGLLAIRFRGIDPDRWLGHLLPWVSWMFSLPAIVMGVTFILAAVALTLTEWDTLSREWPGFSSFLQADRLLWFAGTMAVVKICHELGHALTCKKLGGECRELGVMLLALTPCLYCNVSDAWLLPRRWQRMAVTAAGIYVELVLAALATFVWHWTTPGIVHSLCLYVMLIGSINTLLLNGNPLLRYDGYYLLSDAVDVPNLRGRSQRLLRGVIARIFFGASPEGTDRSRGLPRVLLLLYGLLSSLYGWVVVFGILWMLYHAAARRELQAVVVGFGILLVGGRIAAAIGQMAQWIGQLRRDGRWHAMRFLSVSLVVATMFGALLLIPLPQHIRAPALIRAANPRPVFVTSPGQLHMSRDWRAGETVQEHEVLATLVNREIEQDLARLRAQVERQRRSVELLESRQVSDPEIAASLPTARAALADARDQLRQREEDARRLTLRAPVTGILLAADPVPHAPTDEPRLQRTGEPFDPRNEGAWLDVGTTLCRIAPGPSCEAVLLVDQSDVPLIAVGDRAVVTTLQTAGLPLEGVVTDVAARPIGRVPPVLAASGLIPLRASATGTLETARPVYEVRVQLESPPSSLLLEQQGRGAVTVARASLLHRGARLLRRTLKFEM